MAQLRVNSFASFIPLTVSYSDAAPAASLGEWNRSGGKLPASSDPQLLNRYSYSRENPTTMYDPSGSFVWIAVGAVVGGVAGAGFYAATHWDQVQQGNINWVEAGAYAAGGALLGSGVGLMAEAAGAGAAAVAAAPAAQQAAQRASVWALPPLERGVAIENTVGRNLPRNFPVIDRFVNGVATSVKSIDLNAATYQSVANLTRTVRGYIDTMAVYKGQPIRWAGVQILPGQVSGRAVDLAVPSSGWTQAQWDALVGLQQYAQGLGVTFNIIQIP